MNPIHKAGIFIGILGGVFTFALIIVFMYARNQAAPAAPMTPPVPVYRNQPELRIRHWDGFTTSIICKIDGVSVEKCPHDQLVLWQRVVND